ncbi:MAG: hypothetical protein IJC44_02090 [Clostridia bacterium]|nr:hypothetical protein [Clostridia bacterium]
MNLKEAFRFQNKLQQLMDEAQAILNNPGNVTRTEKTYLRKKVMPEAENETVVVEQDCLYADRITEVAGFLLWILAQREALSAAIRRTKNTLPIDMDGEVCLNTLRQSAAQTLRRMSALRGSEMQVANGGFGYRFNAEGNQVTYKCDVRNVTTINFDRNIIRKYLTRLDKTADAVSSEIDRCMVNAEVEYEAPFDVNDGFADIFEGWLA